MLKPIIFLSLAAGLPHADPKPGDVFREYTYASKFSACDPDETSEAAKTLCSGKIMVEHNLDVLDLEDATAAELSVEFWGGHIGTTAQRVLMNGKTWINLPQPHGTPTAPECYYRTLLGRLSVPLPLSDLKRGRDVFQFSAGPQSCYSFHLGFYWVYSFTVRVYYKPSKQHASGSIVQQAASSTVGTSVALAAEASGEDANVASVDFIGLYDDFSWEGDGESRRWNYQTERGA